MSPDLIPKIASTLGSENLLREIYSDLARPGVAQVGKAIGGILGLGNTALWPVHLLNERAAAALKANLERYRKSLEKIPVEEIQPVPPEVGVPVAEKLAYVTNPELAAMYTKLLKCASCQSTSGYAHPAFANIIGNMSPDEAILLKEISRSGYITYFVEEQLGIRVVSFREELSDQLVFPRNVQAYLSNFDGMGLTTLTLGKVVKSALNLPASQQPTRRPGEAQLTLFGKLFSNACVDTAK